MRVQARSLQQMINLPPGETLRYFVSSIYAAVGYFAAFTILLWPTIALLRSNGRVGTPSIIIKLASVLAARELVASIGQVVSIGAMLIRLPFFGTIRNYVLATLAICVAITVRILFNEILFRSYRPDPDSVKKFLSHL
jgi:hypothetical protein